MKNFTVSLLVTTVCLICAACWGFARAGAGGAAAAAGTTAILAIMEVSLSFDNAVVNASVLKTWNRFWQNLFLSLGMLVAVFGMRLLFPLAIVAAAAHLDMADVWVMARHDPAHYAWYLSHHHAQVAAFGGAFLLLVFLNFVIDEDKQLHWLGPPERSLGALGKLGPVPVLIALLVVLGSMVLIDPSQQLAVLLAGIWGIAMYSAVDLLSELLEDVQPGAPSGGAGAGTLVRRGSIGALLYLEVLDASFSFDGVIGAFAISNDIVIIMLGLSIGAMFVRSLTIVLVRKGTLDQFVYLEHGAHYAIGILALIMFASMRYQISEMVTGLTGVAFIAVSLWSSIRYRRRAGGTGSLGTSAETMP